MADLVVVMGVSGAGKTCVAEALARAAGWPWLEGDDYHPARNIAKQAAGRPLENEDRADWIENMVGAVRASAPEVPVILACSALNEFVRARLAELSGRRCRWVLLDVPRAELQRRMEARADHFMPASLLDSQLAALTPPEDAIRIDGVGAVEAICERIVAALSAN